MMDDARKQEKRKGFHQGGQVGGHSRWFRRVGIMALAVTVLSVVAVGVAQADDQSLPSMTISYQKGTITAIYEKTLGIDGRTYGVMPDVLMLDEHGDVLDLGRLVVSAEVKFHVMKEQSNMIDKMIVTLPR